MTTPGFSSATDPFLSAFREAAGLAATYEIAVRLLADKTPAIQGTSLAYKFHETETAVRAHFKQHLIATDEELLDGIRPLRNKLLHGELRVARERMAEMGHPAGPQRIRKAAIPTGEALTVESLLKAVATATEFSDSEPQEGGLMGWMVQMNADGSLRKAAELFNQALAVVDRLAALE